LHESITVPAYRCDDCDREVCTHCVVRIVATQESLCPDCASERESSRDQR
jgi:hypothetical protein